MYQEFDANSKATVNRDEKDVVRELLHQDEHVVSEANTPQLAATDYLSKFGSLLGLGGGETDNLALTHDTDLTDAGGELRFQREKQQFDTTTVMYQQTHFGLPVWHGGISIHMKRAPYRIISSQSTRHADLDDLKPPSKATMTRLKKLNKTTLAKALGLTPKAKLFDLKSLAVQRVRLLILRYKAERREMVEGPPESGQFGHQHATLSLPPVAKSLQEGRHYVAAEVQFALAAKGQPAMNWSAIIEADTLSVLYLRVFADDVNGMVFQDDPITNNAGPAPNANNAALNPVRTTVLLQGLVPPAGGVQTLIGNKVRIVDVELPTLAPPTQPAATDFNFNARTNNFSAVNAYYHCDRFFRLMESMGFTLAGFFGAGTAFPNAVDHRGFGSPAQPAGNIINAHCLGTAGGAGILQTTFALADTSDIANPLGIACDYRVVLHELAGHGVLYPHVHGPNFGFAHSAGDSIAVITCDPDTHAPDRFLSFPWVDIGRRHDRTPAAGFGWSGNIALHPFNNALDGGGYNNEQILSSTLFRFYLSIGGGSTSLSMRQFAARYAVYLILRAISTLTPATNPSNAAGFATALMNADLGDWTTEGHAGGAYGKVIRWAFEKQGLYQPAGTPVPNNNVGSPPAVDVYVEDGRHGEYQFQPNHWSCHAIWNRRLNDGLTTHQEPIVGVTNFAFVKIKNRGTQAATGVVVKAFHANPAAGLVYPNDWQPMTTAQLPAANVPPNSSAEITVGPFQWVPSAIGHECMFMVVSANGDASNVGNMTAGDSIPEWRLVPNDNNIGQRNVFPVAGGGGLKGLLEALDGIKITIKNPLNVEAKVIVQTVLPRFLVAKGWKTTLANPGAEAFSLKSAESKPVVLKLVPGTTFTAAETRKAIKASDATIHVIASANGIVVGGMSYELTV
ncbi:MAG: hypothetical protein NTW28_27550 [Candidatus Solibacter sp.]|nr:hypothetical protein [Candidatus Solibacter sp.]